MVRHTHNVISGTWSERAAINGTELEAGDLVQIHPSYYKRSDLTEGFPFGIDVISERVEYPYGKKSFSHTIRETIHVEFATTTHIFAIAKFDEEGNALLLPVGDDGHLFIPVPIRNLRKLPPNEGD